MTMLAKCAILAGYASLLTELLFLHVPSVASSMSLFSPRAGTLTNLSSRTQQIFAYSKLRKIFLFAVPLGVVYATFLLPLVAVYAGENPLGDDLFAADGWPLYAGIALLLIGRVISWQAAVTIRECNRQRGDSFFLHTSGLFRRSRNPGLIGMYLFILGLWLMLPSFLMILGIAIYIVHMHFKVRIEEDFLRHKFAAVYDDYCARTRRYF